MKKKKYFLGSYQMRNNNCVPYSNACLIDVDILDLAMLKLCHATAE
jgi:hypothetical protein